MSFLRLNNPNFIFTFIAIWLGMLFLSPLTLESINEYGVFSFMGVLGAIFANSTGAGGGVVFIPLFNQLNFTEQQSIATSFAIQCFGMTAGALTWWFHYKHEKTQLRLWQGFKRIISITTASSIVGIWWVYGNQITSPSSLYQSFSWFSLVLGVFIIVTVFFLKAHRECSQLYLFDWLALITIGFFGGALTAWLSVGVGELLAIYLILRRFDISLAVAAAVIVSAFTVWAAIWQHTFIQFDVYWQVVIFAGPGAVLGGIFAKTLVTRFSATKLKLFFAFWLLIIGLVGIT
ncbi:MULTISPECIES: sulfite exporter TauE/SafE family protein [unclassified Colwellia]|uniref:sulfite exporter TauE/SafE family protein n=1 Tax=unclassified Colwellia TaxID=196834 RepID=UPI0015F45ED5|nr:MULTISPECIES: sulfite exporter TauE/SafE family protein [unclassified Colwellia]MBA6233245.1 sulfite exporter TauE/SafE family protein [Colwellia sp. MB02u-7]MBA6236335.1 sulfite exporter TauE/SafE family protein [Colwellia sp. MB02u-11]MBA6298265.1 sulfite exporter TauE/SafE family protein [Colwellia sp. MB3u-22]MBA6311910.1 sulfite exporter TauE/SafE family protein [Colwellia sp. MB3u-64]